ncbi:hypothetical protein [Lentzea sp. NPDC004782]|uniref:hypothetical protein n=1 Tax=Lentzea sp. NPDC004782 TaxID=3154458 RepID=UPI0033B2DB19
MALTGDGATTVAFDHAEPSFKPQRTWIGIVIALVDINLFMLQPPEEPPRPRGRLRLALRDAPIRHLDGRPPAVQTAS